MKRNRRERKKYLTNGRKRSNLLTRPWGRTVNVSDKRINILIEFDKNVITPGTEFMYRLSKSL